jgi:hypothetical protein
MPNTKATSMTLHKIPDDEEIFVLRAQDVTAPVAVLEWIKSNLHNTAMTNGRLQEAFEVALRMRDHPNQKMPD